MPNSADPIIHYRTALPQQTRTFLPAAPPVSHPTAFPTQVLFSFGRQQHGQDTAGIDSSMSCNREIDDRGSGTVDGPSPSTRNRHVRKHSLDGQKATLSPQNVGFLSERASRWGRAFRRGDHSAKSWSLHFREELPGGFNSGTGKN
ncbi:uncharacterized protein ARMOST_03986 [Armillaria ostoyae]|uniref:Uncharacterized protein n=1 Tax=Armillaria ostoyae TaxID=47428 RepID=A0A284QW44_ARMOS|nr:uncharacterized protein ARMOST_03986 [Armillaria ostoyae]